MAEKFEKNFYDRTLQILRNFYNALFNKHIDNTEKLKRS